MLAWLNTFYFRSFDYSWFFNFHKNIKKKFSVWFHKWFSIFGPIQDILPQVQEGFHLFSRFHKDMTNHFFQSTCQFLHYFLNPMDSLLGLSLQNDSILARQFKVKWWANYTDLNKINIFGVQDWYLRSILQILLKKCSVQKVSNKQVASASSKEAYRKLLMEFLSQLG